MDIASTLYSKQKLYFNKNGNFRILCVSDIHGGVGYDEENTVKYLSALLDETKPALVLFLGDIAGPGVIHISTPEELRIMITGLTSPLTERNIPWAHVYGNHDNNFGVENDVAQKVYEEFPLCLSKAGEDYLPGCGNWVLPVYNENTDKPGFLVWGLDSHRGNDLFKKNCGLKDDELIDITSCPPIDGSNRGIDFSQVLWYADTSAEIEKTVGRKIPGLMTMHVPLNEMAVVAVREPSRIIDGVEGKDYDCQGLNSGMMRAAVERGDIKAFCFGHNHCDSYSLEYCGIRMCYDGYLSLHASHDTSTLGGRVFDISLDDPFKISSHLVLVKDIIDLNI